MLCSPPPRFFPPKQIKARSFFIDLDKKVKYNLTIVITSCEQPVNSGPGGMLRSHLTGCPVEVSFHSMVEKCTWHAISSVIKPLLHFFITECSITESYAPQGASFSDSLSVGRGRQSAGNYCFQLKPVTRHAHQILVREIRCCNSFSVTKYKPTRNYYYVMLRRHNKWGWGCRGIDQVVQWHPCPRLSWKSCRARWPHRQKVLACRCTRALSNPLIYFICRQDAASRAAPTTALLDALRKVLGDSQRTISKQFHWPAPGKLEVW